MGRRARFQILGPVRAGLGESTFGISAARERILLAMLLLYEGGVVSQDVLQDAIWADRPPKDARNQVHRCVSRLRGRLGRAGLDGGVIATDPDGYRIVADREGLDLLEFRSLRHEAKRAAANGDTAGAATRYRAALDLWRGPACAGVESDSVRRAAAMLDAERIQTVEECAWAQLARHAPPAGELVPELIDAIRQHPYREELHAALMLAHYRAGRQADALAVYRRLRHLLHEELGTEPGSKVRHLHQAILCQDMALSTPVPAGKEHRSDQDWTRSAMRTRIAETLPDIPRELPAEVAGFVGRDSVLRAIDEAWGGIKRGTAIATIAIAGPAGVGKTALAVHWSHRASDRFPDGQLYLNLRGYAQGTPLRPVEALAALLRSLGAPPERIPTEEDAAARLYRSYLADRRALVVLDNAYSASQIRPLLPGVSSCRVLVTSRDRLTSLVARDGAHRITLEVFTPDEARALLARLLGQAMVGAEPDAIDALARGCGHLPLALRLAAASIVDHPHGSPIAAYVANLARDRLATLDSASDEESSVRATIGLSYERLPADARRMFRMLGLTPGPDLTPDAAAVVCGGTVGDARNLIATLARAHLVVECSPGRFTLHDLLRIYARDRAEREESVAVLAEAKRRLLWWYTNGAAAAADMLYPDMPRLSTTAGAGRASPTFGEPAQALEWLHAERAVLVAAVRHAAADGPCSFAWLLTSCLYGYFWHQRYPEIWMTSARVALTAAEREHGLAPQAAMRWGLAGASRALGRSSEATEHLARAVSLARRSGWRDGQGYALTNLGMVHTVAGRFGQATGCLAEALRLARHTGNRALEAQALGNLGYLSKQAGRLREAADHCARQLSIVRQIYTTDNHNTARSLSNLACVEIELGLLDAAHEKLIEALALHRRAGRRLGEVNVLIALAEERACAGDTRASVEMCEAALSLAELIDDPRKVCEARQVLGTAYLQSGRPDQAIAYYQSTLELVRQTGDVSSRFGAMQGLASAWHALGHDERAAECATEAWDLARRSGYRVFEGRAMTILAEIRAGQGKHREAGDLAERALRNHRESGSRLGEAETLAVLVQVLSARGSAEDASEHRNAARRLFADIGVPMPAHLAHER